MKTDLLRHTEIFIFLAIVFSIYTAVLLTDKKNLTEEGRIIGLDYKNVIDTLKKKEKKIKKLKTTIRKYRDSLADYANNTPPHIEIDGTENYYFKTGKAKLLKDFKIYFKQTLLPTLVEDLKKCKNCNALYIVGHTDNKPVNIKEHSNNNFDYNLVNQIIKGDPDIKFEYNTNTDLGLLRATSIYLFLKNQKGLEKIKYWFPYSAGPLIDSETSLLITNLDDSDPIKNKKKRRIEIWLYAYKTEKNKKPNNDNSK